MTMREPPARGRADHAALEAFVDGLGDTVLDWRFKGFGSRSPSMTVADVQRDGVRLAELGTPMMTIDVAAVADNVLAMARWCEQRGLLLAPHGTTTMAPNLWLAQLLSGSVAITVATSSQLRAARAFGVGSVVLANELVDPRDLAWVAAELARDPQFDFLCWVDSVASVRRMDEALAGAARPVPVCIEVGSVQGRAGARGLDEVHAIAEAVVGSPELLLAGLSGYEGAVPGAGTDQAGLHAVDEFLRAMVVAHEALANMYQTPRVTVTAGGSGFFDRVAAVLGLLGQRAGDQPVDVVLRSGAYIVHDDGNYARVTPSTRAAGPELRSAIHVWSQVLSRPQDDLVILDAGRRDLPYDMNLPVVLAGGGRDAGAGRDVGGFEVLRLNDQHCFVSIPADSDVAVADVLKLGVSHPCTAFDKWRAIPMIDAADGGDPRVVDVALTFF